MKCNKCGSEVKETNLFCTNCGEKLADNKNNNEIKIIKIRFTHLIILILGIALIIMMVNLIVNINKNSNKNVELTNKSTKADIDKEYITTDSDVSPTGKEFIGEFTENLTNLYKDITIGNASSLKKYYDTSIKNMQKFSLEISSRDIKYEEIVFYYNTTNNRIIGAKQAIYNVKSYEEITKSQNTSTNEVLETFMTAATNIFVNAHNDNSSQEFLDRYNKYSDYMLKNFSNVNNTECEYNNYKFTYRVLGDIICVVTRDKVNDNKIEVLLFAHNENNMPEDEIKLWYEAENKKSEIYLIENGNKKYFIDNQGNILDEANTNITVPIIEGLKTNFNNLGNIKELSNEDIVSLNTINTIMKVVKSQNIYNIISKIIIENNEYILFAESQKKYIYLGDATDIELKIKYAKGIMEKERESGNIYLNGDLKNGFKPYFRTEIDTN